MTTAALTLTITQGGQAALAAAQLAQVNGQLAIATLGLTAQTFVPAPTVDRLPGEFRRIPSISGALVGDQTVHLVLRDDDAVTYSANGFGLYLTDGTLFAVYSQATQLLEKSAQVSLMAALDVAFPIVGVDHLTFGDANWLNPPATSATRGVIAIATQPEVEAGTDATKAVTPATLAARLAEIITSLLAQIAHAVADYIPLAQKGSAGGVAQLDSATKVPVAQIPIGAGGVAALDGDGHVPAGQLALASIADAQARLDATRPVTSAALGGAGYLRLSDQGSTENGSWRMLSDGTLEQEGEVTTSAGSDEPLITVSLPVAFADTGYRVSLTPVLNAPAIDRDTWVQLVRSTKTAGSFQVQYQRPGTSGSSFGLDGFEWRAWRREPA